jgi:hypothetical protein
MKASHLFTIFFILVATTLAWWLLGGTISYRTSHVQEQNAYGVSERWGPPLTQYHPTATFKESQGETTTLQPVTSDVKARLGYEPVKMGLLWQRTYRVEFEGSYTFQNSTGITQKLAVTLQLPKGYLGKMNFTLGEGASARKSLATPRDNVLVEHIEVAPGQSVPVQISYATRGSDLWTYAFNDASRIRDFKLAVQTDFTRVNYPVSSPTHREATETGLTLEWNYEDAISAPGIAVEMPDELNAGPIASQIAFWAPLSLALFFGVIVMTTLVRGIRLHPVNYFFLAAGFFTFPLLFSYMLDLVPVHLSFLIAAGVSLMLVCGYLRAAGGAFLFRISLLAQFAYMVLFSASFFVKGLTGLTLTLGGVTTLAVLMALTAKVDWSVRLGGLSPKLA